MRLAVVSAVLLAMSCAACAADAPAFRIEGDGIPEPLAAGADAARGRAMLAAREPANCILCHGAPADLKVRFSGNLAPSLDGVGARWSAAQLRLRLVDSSRFNPQTIMPSYFRTEGLVEVAAPWRGKPIMTARDIEDLIAYLSTLK